MAEVSVQGDKHRSVSGRFAKKKKIKKEKYVEIDHNYQSSHLCNGEGCQESIFPLFNNFKYSKNIERNSWKEGRRFVEFGVLLDNLRACDKCLLGPIPLTYDNVIGEMTRDHE